MTGPQGQQCYTLMGFSILYKNSLLLLLLLLLYLRAREKVQGRKIRKLNWEGFFSFLNGVRKATSLPFLIAQNILSGGRVDDLFAFCFDKGLLAQFLNRGGEGPTPESPEWTFYFHFLLYSFMRSRAIVTHLGCFAKSSEDSLWWDDRMTYLVRLVLFLSQPLITPLMLLSH